MCISDIYIILCQSAASICTNNIIQSSEVSEELRFLMLNHHFCLQLHPK